MRSVLYPRSASVRRRHVLAGAAATAALAAGGIGLSLLLTASTPVVAAACAQTAASSDFWTQMLASSPYKKWAQANPGGATRVDAYRNGGPRPVPQTLFEGALLDAVDMGCASAGTTSTATTTTTAGTTTAAATTTTTPPPSPCTRTASLTGSDSNPGTTALPFRTVTKLVSSLGPAETGCINAGTYTESVDILNSGAAGFPITLESTPGQRATLHSHFVVWDSGNDWTFLNLNFDSSGFVASPIVHGDRITFRGNDITSHHIGTGAPQTAICLILGDSNGLYGLAIDPVVDGNRIHDCGNLPSDNRGHGLYDEGTRNARIVNNYIYDNADRGIQLYPDAQGGLIANNVIDGNGENVQFGGQSTGASSDNTVRDNIISNANIRSNVESYYSPGEPVGQRNVVDSNCIFGPIGAQVGFTVSNTITADPLYVDRAGKNFSLQAGSPCAGKGPR